MRYPVGKAGSTLDSAWYNAQEFGSATSYGYHEGDDLNTRTGGDSDLGQPLYAVADGKIVYFHNASHPTSGFGRHMVLECQTPRGTRWYHYCHCQDITAQVKEVKEGEQIGTLGKSGTTAAHLHFAVFRVDPSGLYKGIDSIAKTKTELNASWEKFEILSMTENKELEACLIDREKFWKERDEAISRVGELEKNIADRAKVSEEKDRQDQDYFDSLVVTLAPDPDEVKGMSSREIVKYEVNKFIDQESSLQKQLKDLQKELEHNESLYKAKISSFEKQLESAQITIDDLTKELKALKELRPATPTEKPFSGYLERLSRLINSIKSVLRRILWW